MHLLTASLQHYWATHFPLAIPTHFPGVPTRLSQATQWVELWIDRLDTPPSRSHSPDRFSVLVTLHLFARDRQNLLAAQQLANAATQTLTHQQIPLLEDVTDIQSLRGWLSLHEPQLRDLSRLEPAAHPPLQHLVLSFSGTAHLFHAASTNP
jgi:hypothetical protein